MCSKSDMVQLLLNHPNMKTLRAEAGVALVQRQSGDAAGMALAVQAATAPTEGQRVLQNGYRGAIAGGESREQMSTTIGEDGLLTQQRVVERSVELPGAGINLQTQQVQQAVVADIDGETLRVLLGSFNQNMDKVASVLDTVIPVLVARNADLETRLATLEIKHARKRAREDAKSICPKQVIKQETRTRKSHPQMEWRPFLTFPNGKWGYKRAKGKQSKNTTSKYMEKQGFDTSMQAFIAMETAHAEYEKSVVGKHAEDA